jgi:class 3 adenylate cyclase/tetratricopeptide (TPR) repeat protein
MSEPRAPGAPDESDFRRRLTVLFTDLSDSTHLSGAMEAEVYAEMLGEVRRIFRQAVTAHQGTINQFQGDGLQALFGYPHASEHDARRAVAAALEVHEGVRALRARFGGPEVGELSVHSGVHAGVVLARAGDVVAGQLEVFGPAPGVAKHLSDVAERDEILVSVQTLGPDSELFEVSDLRSVALKGRDEPLRICRVLRRRALRTRFEAHARRGLLALTGRNAQMQALHRAWERARAGHPAFVLLVGEAGAGKTRLAEEFLHSTALASAQVRRGACEGELSAEPLQPLLQMLDSRAQVAAGDAGAAQAPDRAIRTLAEHFVACARQQPLVLFIDDWQWADDGTRQVIHALLDAAGLPVLVLAAARPAGSGPPAFGVSEIIELRPLADAEVEATIAGLLPAADPFVVAEIRRRAGGNPLFVEELCHAAAEAGLHAGPASSAWLETLIESRVARLPATHRQVLNAAAVIGSAVPAWLLQGLSGHAPEHHVIQELATLDLLYPGERPGTLRFKHGITREVVYGTIGLAQRRAMHAQVVQLLLRRRREPPPELLHCEALAYHSAGAGDHVQAARYAEIAGDKAMGTSVLDLAKLQYRHAIEMLERLPPADETYQTWRSIVRRLGLASVFDPAQADVEVFARALRRAERLGDAAGRAYAGYWHAYVDYALGHTRSAVIHCEHALAVAESLADQRLVGQCRATLGQAAAAAADYRRALALLGEAVGMGREGRSRGRSGPGLAYSLACRASVLGDLGRFAESAADFEEALASLPGAGHEVEGSVRCWRSGVWLWQGRWAAARADALAAQRVAERVRSLYLYAMSQGLAAYALWRLDPGPGALRALHEANAWLEDHGQRLFISLHHGWLAEALAASGRGVEARSHAARAWQRTRQRDWIGAAMAARAMADVEIEAGRFDAAARHLRLAERAAAVRAAPHEAAHNEVLGARLAWARGDSAAAAQALQRAIEAFDGLGLAGFAHSARELAMRGGAASAAARR